MNTVRNLKPHRQRAVMGTTMAGNPRVVLHVDRDGSCTVYADPGVTVIRADDLTPSDRLYRCQPLGIPAGVLDGPMGHFGDNNPGHARLEHAIREAFEVSLPVKKNKGHR